MTLIGNKTVLQSQALIVPSGDTVRLNFDVEGVPYFVEVIYDDDAAEQGVNYAGISNDPSGTSGTRITLAKWTSELGVSLNSPLLLATFTNGTRLECLICSSKIGPMSRLNIQFMASRNVN